MTLYFTLKKDIVQIKLEIHGIFSDNPLPDRVRHTMEKLFKNFGS